MLTAVRFFSVATGVQLNPAPCLVELFVEYRFAIVTSLISVEGARWTTWNGTLSP